MAKHVTKKKIERLSARLHEERQAKVTFLMELGIGPTELVRDGIDLLYEKIRAEKISSIPVVLASVVALDEGRGPNDLSSNYKKYYKDLLIEKHSS